MFASRHSSCPAATASRALLRVLITRRLSETGEQTLKRHAATRRTDHPGSTAERGHPPRSTAISGDRPHTYEIVSHDDCSQRWDDRNWTAVRSHLKAREQQPRFKSRRDRALPSKIAPDIPLLIPTVCTTVYSRHKLVKRVPETDFEIEDLPNLNTRSNFAYNSLSPA